MAVLIDTVENLYYALYACITIELASIELCGSFRIDTSALRIELPYLMPEADHLYRIVMTFKDVLDSPEICAILRKDIIDHFQREYVKHLITKEPSLDELPFDALRYRPFAKRTVSCRHGSYFQKWKGLIPCFDSIPAETMAAISDKYFTMHPVTIPPPDIPFEQLPWIFPEDIGMAIWDTDIVADRRMSKRAQELGTCIGEERKNSPTPSLYYLVRQRKCICDSICSCSLQCTLEVERPCPCAERVVRIMSTKRRLAHRKNGPTFAATASTTARMFFDGLAQLKRDVKATDIANELGKAFELLSLLISKERETRRNDTQANI